MGQLTIRHNPSPRRNPNPNRKPTPPVMGHVTILRRGDPPTAFLNNHKTTPPPPPSLPAATNNNNNNNQKKKNTKKKKEKKKAVAFRDGVDDVELFYTATCRIGPEPGMVPMGTSALFDDFSVLESPPPSSLPLPLSLLRKT